MSLPLPVIERLFDRLAATYGNQFLNNWAAGDINKIKSLWAHELGGYENNLKAIGYALENLPEHVPNLIAFRNLCRMAPEAEVLRIESKQADPVIAKMIADGLREKITIAQPIDRLQWARNILLDSKGGLRRTPTVVQMARNALETT